MLLPDTDAALARADVDAVAIVTSADARHGLIRQALNLGLHIVAEKPLAATLADEATLLDDIEATDRVVTVNLFNRNTPYHRALVAKVREGAIGTVLSVDVAHLTPDLLPGEGHQSEGPPFHDCGMHYVDLARWYAGSDYAAWHAQGLRVWDWPDPWWVDVHGRFDSGAIFHVAQTFAYGQGAAEITARSHLEVVGTHGVIRLHHDFREVVATCHERDNSIVLHWPYGGKKLDVLAEEFARALDGEPVFLPTARDSVIASRLAQQMLDEATSDAPAVGGREELQWTLAHKSALADHGRAFPQALLDQSDRSCNVPPPDAVPDAT
jgi:myo-inositol 2-dehydrogenase/D-chiro-inositol 1-dehydrogenase